MRWRVAVSLGLLACANGSVVGDDGGTPSDGGSPPEDVTTIPLDAGKDALDAAIDVFDAGCATDGALGGIGVPAGATATATSSTSTDLPSQAIDGDQSTYWNAGGFTGSITVAFASPVTIDGVHLWVTALPTTSETYTVFGIQDANTTQLAQSTQTAQQGGGALQTIAIPNAAYDAIRVDVVGNQSWVAIVEMAFTTTSCP
jgi:hypothetical protein